MIGSLNERVQDVQPQHQGGGRVRVQAADPGAHRPALQAGCPDEEVGTASFYISLRNFSLNIWEQL